MMKFRTRFLAPNNHLTLTQASLKADIKMSRNIILGHCFISEDDVKLASLIPNIQDPELDSLESVIPLSREDYTVKKAKDGLTVFQNEKDRDFRAFLSQVLNWTSKRSQSVEISLAAPSGCVYTLRQPAAWFGKLCEDVNVRKWLQRQIEEGKDVHFVIGLYTLFDATTAEGLSLISNNNGAVSIPLDTVLGLPDNPLTQAGLSANLKNGFKSVNRCTAPGEQIFAIRTKKLEFKFWHPKDVQNARLECSTRWVISSDNRSSDDDDSEIVEVSLGSSSNDDDEDTGQNFSGITDGNTQFYLHS